MRTASLAQGALLALALLVAAGPAVASLAQGAPRKIEILVVDRGGKPLPGAKVRFAVEDEDRGEVDDPFAPGGKRQALRFDTPPSASSVDRPLKGRPEVTANAAGKIHIPCPERKALLVSARHSDRWSFLFLPRDWSETAGRAHPPGEPVRLELAPDWDLRVSVVDERGRPLANVPVRVRSRPFNTGSTSDRARELVFEHVGFELRDATEPLDVYVDAPLAPPVRATLDPKRPPAGPITLRMPPTGSVQVSVVDPGGEPLLRRPVIVWLRITTDEPPVSERRFDGFAPYHVRPTRDGKARFDHVSLGQNLEVFVRLREGDSQKLRGPRAPGETVCTTLTFEPPDSADLARAGTSPAATGSLRGRLLLDPGIPARAIEIKLHDDSPAARRAALSPLLSSDGAFSFSSVPVGPARLEVSTHGFLPAAERRPLVQARVEVAAGESPDTDPVEIDLRGMVFAHTIALKGLEREHGFQASAFFAPA
ncbi:MAG TPA: carboxypeptidase-like regulatory domain-containing protein, partial [Planctomycetota bacterium]|nr:carboxypeptidase-like regulatory domain-containing protein [Planctomycetota bacterium]